MKREEILESARTCVCTDRNKQYGEPEDNFKAIAEMWMSHFKAKGYDVSITATDVALMLIEFKVARAITAKTPKSDTFIDIAGYAACGGGDCYTAFTRRKCRTLRILRRDYSRRIAGMPEM